jgi:protein-L-isoaspartate(D-aspartate) O-methyltransferase
MVDLRAVRRAMVDGQVRTSDVTNLDLIDAMLDVPREAFVPERLAAFAYLDRDLALPTSDGVARYLLKPVVTAKLIQAADIGVKDRVLVVGSATGYSAAVVSRLAAAVVALEEDSALADAAQTVLRRLGLLTVTPVTGRLVGGWPAAAPYDVILVEGGVETMPDALFAQLSEGGRLVAVVYGGLAEAQMGGQVEGQMEGKVGKATLFRSVRGEVGGRPLFDSTAPLLPGFRKAPAFVF